MYWFQEFFFFWLIFFWIFYIGDCVIYEQRQFYVFLPNLYTFYFLFLYYCISKAFQYIIEKEW